MKILIIDDEFAALTKMKALLSAYGDCTLTTNANQAVQLGANAIKRKAPFDLITIDINLSQASGLDVLETFNKMEIQADLVQSKKIIVTASGTKDNLSKAYLKGCDGFLVKPVKRDTLDEKMSSLGLVKKAQPSANAPTENHNRVNGD